MFAVYLVIGIAILFLFFGIISWRDKIFEGAFIGILFAVLLGIGSYLTYDDITTMQEYTVLEKVTIAENENVKVYYIIKDKEENKYITTKNVVLKVGETFQLKKEEMNNKCKIVKFEEEE